MEAHNDLEPLSVEAMRPCPHGCGFVARAGGTHLERVHDAAEDLLAIHVARIHAVGALNAAVTEGSLRNQFNVTPQEMPLPADDVEERRRAHEAAAAARADRERRAREQERREVEAGGVSDEEIENALRNLNRWGYT